MINLKLFKKNPEEIKKKILQKDSHFDIEKLLQLTQKHNLMLFEISSLQEKINKLSNLSSQKEKDQEIIKNEVKEIKNILQEKTSILNTIESEFNFLLLSCPNITEDDLPIGGKEKNQIVKKVGNIPTFDFDIKNIL
jgi:seryl-tRNA synthetase